MAIGRQKRIPSVRLVLSVTLLLGGLGFILALIVRNWERIERLLIEANWHLFFWSIVLGIAGTALTSILFKHLLIKHGLVLPSKKAHQLFFYAQIAKYIPGKIWGIVYQTSLVYREGTVLTITTANIDLMIISIITNLAIALVIISMEIQAYVSITIFLIGLGATVFIACSCFLGNAIDWSLSKFKAEYVAKYGRRCKPAFGGFPIAVYYCVVSVIGLLAYYLMIHAVFGFSVREALTLAAYLILAWVAGVLAFIVPAGVGVREFLFIAFGAYMVPTIPVEVLATIAVISRFWQVLQEVSAAFALLLWDILGGGGRSAVGKSL